MSTELHDKHLLKARDASKILTGTQPRTGERAVHDARRALDHAVMSIFELAMSLESLSDAIRRVRSEPPVALLPPVERGAARVQ